MVSPRIVVIGLVAALTITGVAVTVSTLTGEPSTAAGEPRVVSQEPCPESEFTCVTLRVPIDHFGSGGQTMDVTFAWLPASGGEREGVFVTATGGPGGSGISLADDYTSTFDPSIPERFDIVFFDQRGIGLSEPIQCVDAAYEYYSSDVVPTTSSDHASAYADASRAFSAACLEEAGIDADRLPAYATTQVVEDLELFRRWLGADRLDLYGESYGTQLVQVYAAAHPDNVASLILDGPVDLTLEGTDYWAEGGRAFESVLLSALEACDEVCVDDVDGGDLVAAWDALAADLADGPIAYDYVLAGGSSETRELSLADLETASAGYVYDTFDRMLLQRAVAYAARGELLPMARLAFIGVGADPDTLQPIEDPTWSDALYFAVECMDYGYGNGSTDEREAAYLAQGEAEGMAAHRLGSVYYGDLPCASWPAHRSSSEPSDYLRTDAYPILVLASTTDPATPYAGARRIFEQAGDGYLVSQPGGPHVIYGRGNACPDDLVTALLVDREPPSSRETECEPMAPDPYVRLPPESASADDDAALVLLAVDDEILFSPDFWVWTGSGKMTVGCLHGGSMGYTVTDVGWDVTLSGCEIVGGLPLTGVGSADDEEGSFVMSVTAPGGTELDYQRDVDYNLAVTGTWFGSPVDIEE